MDDTTYNKIEDAIKQALKNKGLEALAESLAKFVADTAEQVLQDYDNEFSESPLTDVVQQAFESVCDELIEIAESISELDLDE